MVHITSTFRGYDQTALFYQHWHPARAPRAVLVLAHGYAEHSGRYQHVAAHLVRHGYSVYAMDHRGHGRSEGPRADVQRFEEFVLDWQILLDRVRQENPGRGIFVLGHSMGGVIVLLGAMRPDAIGQGMILSGAAVRLVGGDARLMRLLLRLLAAVAPTRGVMALDSATLSRDPAVVRDYDTDPLNYRGRVRACMLVELLKAGDYALAHLQDITWPALILHGGEDRLVDPEGSRLIYEGIRSTDKTLQIYPGLYHEILNEPEKDQVLADITAWLDQHVVAGAPYG